MKGDLMKNKIDAKGFEVNILTQKNEDFISLTDIARYKNPAEPRDVVRNWMRRIDTVEFLGLWEKLHNPDFKAVEFDRFKSEAGRNAFTLSPERWCKTTSAIGIKTSRGRYASGTYANLDIALEFASWISAEFKLYIITEYQRLKQSENYQQKLDWSVKRDLAKLNYGLHTDAVKAFIVPKVLSKSQIRMTYASEADVLNVAMFGMTAKEFKAKFPEKTGNQRDNASIEQNLIMANLEMTNAIFIKQGMSQGERLIELRELALQQLENFLNSRAVERIKKLANEAETKF